LKQKGKENENTRSKDKIQNYILTTDYG